MTSGPAPGDSSILPPLSAPDLAIAREICLSYFDYTFAYQFEYKGKVISTIKDYRQAVWTPLSDRKQWGEYLRHFDDPHDSSIENRATYLISIQLNRLGAAAMMNSAVLRHVLALHSNIIPKDWALVKPVAASIGRKGHDKPGRHPYFERRFAFGLYYLVKSYLKTSSWEAEGPWYSEDDEDLTEEDTRLFRVIWERDSMLIDKNVAILAGISDLLPNTERK